MAQTMIGQTLSSCSPTMGIMGKGRESGRARRRERSHPMRGQKSTHAANQRKGENRAGNQAPKRERERESERKEQRKRK